MKKIYVFGHKNPDTDSVCASISLSYLKNKLGFNTIPKVLGEINNETKFALNYFNVKIPDYLNDVKVRIKDISYHKDFYINESSSIYNTYNYMYKRNITGIPIVNDNKKFVGYVSLKEIAHTMITDNTDFLDTTFENIVNTLNSINYVKIDEEIKGHIVAATYDDETFIKNVLIDKDTILLVGDRKRIIDYAIESKVKLIIIVGNQEINPEQLILSKKNNINVIFTAYTSFETSKLLGLTNKITTIKRNETCVCLDREDYMTDFIETTNKIKHTNYPIVGKNGTCYGMLRLIDINDYEKNKVILVDHNERKQSVDGLEEAEILEIVDHHHISGINTSNPINFRNMAVGSSSTIVYYLFKENNIKIPDDIAGLLLSGIISDTALLNSPTTTFQDRYITHELSNQLNIDYKEYGMKLLKSGMEIEGYTPEDIIYRDYKIYSIDNKKFSISQLLTVDFKEFDNVINNYVKELDKISNKNGYVLSALYISNVITKSSMIIYNTNGEYIIKEAYNLDNIHQGIIIENILSRKKQMVPFIMEVIKKNY